MSSFSLSFVKDVDYEYVYREGDSWEKVQWIGGGASGSCYVATDRHNNSIMVVKQVCGVVCTVLNLELESV